MVGATHASPIPQPWRDTDPLDVRCTHGATISQVEEEHLFYLQARGIERSEAQKLIVEGFFRPVIDRIPVEEIQDFLETAIARKVGI